jgi:hypothetical protein
MPPVIFREERRPLGTSASHPRPCWRPESSWTTRAIPLSRAVVEVHRRRHVESNGEFDSWDFLDPSARFKSKSDEEGRFEVRGFVEPPGDLTITARAAGYLPAEPLPFASGASGIRLALLRAGSIQGRLLLDPRVPVHQLRVWVTESSGETESAHAASILENGAFELDAAPPGIVRVDVVSGEGLLGGRYTEPKPPFATVDGVRVVGGEKTSDPRLTIDLRSSLHTIRVHVRAPDGIEDAGILLQVIDGNGAFSMPYLDDGRASLLTDALPLGLTVVSQGCRSETLSGVTEDVEITLRQGIPVHVQVILEGSLSAPNESVRVDVVPAVDAAGWSFSGDWRCDAAGIARLAAGSPGSHTIRLTLVVETESGSSAVELGRETRIDVMDTTGPQTFQVRITAAELDEARSQLETIGFPR